VAPVAPPAPALNDLGITDAEERDNLIYQGYAPEEADRLMAERRQQPAVGVEDWAAEAPIVEDAPSDPNIHRPENIYTDSLAAMNARNSPSYTGPGSSEANPFVLQDVEIGSEADFAQRRAAMNLSRGMYVQHPDGSIGRMTGDAYIDENSANDQGLGGVNLRERNLGDQSRAFAMATAEQVPFLEDAAVAAAGAISGRGYSDTRDSYRALQEIDNQTNRAQRVAGGLTGFGATMLAPWGAGSKIVSGGANAADKSLRAAALSSAGGALFGAGNADGSLQDRSQAAALGAALSAGTGGILQAGVNRLAQPATDTAQRRLSRMGQELTYGQMLGGGSQRVEDALTSLPFAGDVIRSRQRDTLSSFDNLASNTAIASLGQRVDDTAGRAGVRSVDDIISGAYGRALDPVSVDTANPQLLAELLEARRPDMLTGDAAASLNSTLDNILSQASGEIDGQTWKRIDSQLAAASRQAEAGAATRPEMTALRDRLRQARTAWRDNLGRVSQDALDQVSAADAAEAQYRLVRKASSDVASAGRGGDASPATLNRAVIGEASDRRAARGESLMQDLTDDAMLVLPRTVPDSGTPLRSLVTGAGLGGGGMALGLDPAALTMAGLLTGGVSAAYSKPAIALANQLYRASDRGGSTRDVDGLIAALLRSPVVASQLVPDAQNSTQGQRRARQ
jgi:hypothetical protein